MARPFNYGITITRATDRALKWADAISQKAAQIHRDAPRGGSNRNRFGQPRSAPGEPPATETRTLLGLIELGVKPVPRGGEAVVNYERLEQGDERVAPRPLGRITLENVKAQARSGSGPDGIT